MPPERPRPDIETPPPSRYAGLFDEPDFNDNYFNDQPQSTPGNNPSDQNEEGPLSRLASKVEQSYDDIAEKRPGWRKKLAGFVLASVVHLGLVGAAVSELTKGSGEDSAKAPYPTEQPTKSTTETTAPEETETVDPLIASIKAEYQASTAEKLNKPFDAIFLTPSQRETFTGLNEVGGIIDLFGDDDSMSAYADEKFEERINSRLEKLSAEFQFATKLSSGIEINFYKSAQDDKKEPLEVDVKALDVLMNQIIANAAETDYKTAAADMKELKRKAENGELGIRLSIVVVSDESLCLPEDQSSPDQLVERDIKAQSTNCGAIGENYRVSNMGPTNNQLITVVDPGAFGPQPYYDQDLQAYQEGVTANFGINTTFAHEAAHALFGATPQNGTLNADDEHHLFVHGQEAMMFGKMVELQKVVGADNTKAAYITPFTVEKN
jgi:hypothetical protein